MSGKNRNLMTAVLACAVMAWPSGALGQDIVKEALAGFPPDTIHLEYSNAASLRSLPNYASLHKRYMSPELQKLEDSLVQLGISEKDIESLILGWRDNAGNLDLEGFASGTFDPQAIAARASAKGLITTPLDNQQAYCLGAGGPVDCIVVLSKTLGAFGSTDSLQALLDARSGNGQSLSSNASFAKLVEDGRSSAPIWGVATGPAVANFFKAWMPNQGDLKLDWAQTFQAVQSLTYSVDASDKVDLKVKMDCTTPDAASNLRQLIEGVKVLQQMAWQNQNANKPNPLAGLDVSVNDAQLLLNLSTDYGTLQNLAGQ